MTLQNLIITTTFLLLIFSFGLGVFSLVRNPKSKVVVLWFLASMAVTVWSFGYLLTLFAGDAISAFNTLKVVYFGASLIPILTFHFITAFLYKENSHKYLIYFGYLAALIFLILTTLTSYVISGVNYMENFGHYEEVETGGVIPFLIYFFFFAVYGIILLLKSLGQSDGVRRKQIFYLTLALAIGFAGGASNFVTDLTGIYPYGQMIVWLYPILVTYGIFVDEFKIKIKF